MSAEIVALLASPISRYVGRPADGPLPSVDGELRAEIAIRAGLGVVGDRYFNKPAHRDASVTLMAVESLPEASLLQTRRNVLTRGIDVDALVGRTVELDTGSGAVRLRLRRAAHPCGWLDVTVAPGTRAALRGRGGVRCEPLTDGILRVGPVAVRILDD